MRRAGHLFEQVADFHALRTAAVRAARGKRRQPEAAAFLADLEPEVLRLQRELLAGAWRPGPYRTFAITDPKPRTISAAPFRDRVVHHALCAALEPVFERYAVFDSYACRPGKGTLAALRRAQAHARRPSCCSHGPGRTTPTPACVCSGSSGRSGGSASSTTSRSGLGTRGTCRPPRSR